MKIGRELPILASVLMRDGYRCVACGFDLQCALTVHHTVPRAYGGVDAESNLVTLCANCHKVIHWLSVGTRLAGRETEDAKRSLSPDAYVKIRSLAEITRDHCRRTKQSGNRWIARAETSSGPIPLAEALNRVAGLNKLNDVNVNLMKDVTKRVLNYIPTDVRQDCAFRVPRSRQFFSVNVGNILLFRTPGYPDGAKRPEDDVWLLWPQSLRISVISPRDWRKIENGQGRFASIPCFNLGLSFDETLAMRQTDWKVFAQACRDAAGVSRTRTWVSNVAVD